MTDHLSAAQLGIAILQMVAVNLALSGDNGIVIALAARSLPPARRRAAVLWGSAAAIAMRVALTAVAFELLRLPYVKLVGAAVLLWIGAQLLVTDVRQGGRPPAGDSVFASAAYVMMIANVAMSLDNVLAIAAAAAGNPFVLGLGLAISVLVIAFGAGFVRTVLARFPAIYVICAVLIGYLAGDMLVSDSAVREWLRGHAHWLQGIALGGFHVPVAALIGAALVFPLARVYARVITAGDASAAVQEGRRASALHQRLDDVRAWLEASRLPALLPLAAVVAVTYLGHPLYMHYRERFAPGVAYYSVRLGMTPDQVLNAKGRPTYVIEPSSAGQRQLLVRTESIPHGKTVRSYGEWEFPLRKGDPGSVYVFFSPKTKRVSEVSCYSRVPDCAPVAGITTGVPEMEVVRMLGEPYEVRPGNGSRTLDYPHLHLSVFIENGTVSMLTVENFDAGTR